MISSMNLPEKAASYDIEGNLGLLYVCGEQTGGKVTVVKSLLGRKVRKICGASNRFAAIVDASELAWGVQNDVETSSLESQLIAEGLQDVKVHHVAVGKNHCVALSLDGQLFSWGRCGAAPSNVELGRQLGTCQLQNSSPSKTASLEADKHQNPQKTFSMPSNTRTPHRVLTAPTLFFTQVSCGDHHSAAITQNGDLYTWGRNFEGQLGHVFKTLPREANAVFNSICAWPKYVGFFLGKPRVISASCGSTFTAVLLSDGSVYLLGGRSIQQPSNHCTTSAKTPTLVLESGLDNDFVVKIACGSEHILAVSSAGKMFSWGLNTFGQLGHGRKEGSDWKSGTAFPSLISCESSIKWANVFAGRSYSAATTAEHQLYTWGNGSYGKLGHSNRSDKALNQNCEFNPRLVDVLQHAFIEAVVCTDRNLFAFSPTYISRISPLCGEHVGGYELRIHGSGFWTSNDITVRFVSLTNGELLRGIVGVFCETSGDIVCQAPTFPLPGKYIVEISMNGKHFTSNRRHFIVFRRPQIAAVSAYDAQFAGGEELTLTLRGRLPEICRQPFIRFIRCSFDSTFNHFAPMTCTDAFIDVVAVFDEHSELLEDAEPNLCRQLLRLNLPAFPTSNGQGIAPFTLKISYDGGLTFTSVCVDPPVAEQSNEDENDEVNHSLTLKHKELQPHTIWAHDARIIRICPNSFIFDALPQTLKIELQHVLPPTVARFVVTILHYSLSNEGDRPETLLASSTLSIESIEGNFLTCLIPHMSEWESANSNISLQTAKWWTPYAKTGFVSQVRVSMNSGRTYLPALPQSDGRSPFTTDYIFSMLTPGRLLSLSPNVGMVSGGTQVSIAGDFFLFDTQDAAVKFQWRDSCVILPASCLLSEEMNDFNGTTRRMIFRTPSLPFPSDSLTATAEVEEKILSVREEVEVFVSLDSKHFTDASLSFLYCAIPKLGNLSPQEAKPGAKMTLLAQNAIATPAACVKLYTADLRFSMVVSVEIDEASGKAEFILPELPVATEEVMHVALSLNGQEFTEDCLDITMMPIGKPTFRYKGS